MIYVTDDLQATPASTTGQPSPVNSWQWRRNGRSIENAVASTYRLTDADVGQNITVAQTAANIVGKAYAESVSVTPLAFDPIALYRNNEQGVWYDPSDIDRYMAQGPELVTNGDFSNGKTNWFGAWSIVDGVAVGTPGGAALTGGGFTPQIGKTYLIQFNIVDTTYLSISVGGVSLGNFFASQFVSRYITATSTSGLSFAAGGSTNSRVDNISVKEIAAIDTATMFQDASGTTPVTSMEQPVGLILDKRKGLTLGSELVTNGDFSSGTTGWTLTASASVSSGALVVSSAAFENFATSTASALSGSRWYAISFDVTVTSGVLGVFVSQVAAGNKFTGNNITTSGRKTGYLFVSSPGAGNNAIIFRSEGGFVGSIDNISVRELPGNHAFQTTSTSRPVLSARYNLLTKTEQINDSAWVKLSTASAPSANLLLLPAMNDYAHQSLAPSIVAGRQLSISMELSGSGTVMLGFYDNVSGFQIDPITLTASPVTYTVVKTIGSGATDIRALVGRISGTTATSVTVNRADLRVTNDAINQPSYQRVNTATDYDSTGFKPYLRFDGTDDWLQTNSVDFTATDKMTVFAGVRKLSDAASFPIIAELSSSWSANNGTFIMCAMGGIGGTYYAGSRGTSSSAVTSTASYTPPVTNVLTLQGDIGADISVLRINGAQNNDSTSDQGTGNYGNYPLYIGRRGGTTLPFNGRLYGLIIRGATTKLEAIVKTEQYMAGKTGNQL